MKVEVFDRLPASASCDAALEFTSLDDYFSCRSWYDTFVDTVVGTDGRPEFVVASDDAGTVAAILPLWVGRGKGTPAPEITSLANYYSCLFQPIIAPDQGLAESGIDAIVGHLVKNRSKWSSIDLRPMPDDAWAVGRLAEGFARRRFSVTQSSAFGNWILNAHEMDFEQYFASRRKKMRSTIRSKTNQLKKQFDLAYRIVTSPEDVPSAIEQYDAVYATSWKHEEPYPRFMPQFALALAREGKLRLGVLTLDDKAAAAQLWFHHHRSSHIFKLAYDPEYSSYSVGTLLTMELARYSLDDDGVDCIDFLSGDDDYKKQWMSDRRERIGLEIINPLSVLGAARILRSRASKLKRRLARSSEAPEESPASG